MGNEGSPLLHSTSMGSGVVVCDLIFNIIQPFFYFRCRTKTGTAVEAAASLDRNSSLALRICLALRPKSCMKMLAARCCFKSIGLSQVCFRLPILYYIIPSYTTLYVATVTY